MDIAVELEKLVRHYAGAKTPIHPHAQIITLWIDGDDAYDLMTDIHKKFGTTFRGLKWDDYFHDETSAAWHGLKARLGFPDRRLKCLTFEHLIHVIARGAWFEPPSTNQSSEVG